MKKSDETRVQNLLNSLLYNHLTLAAAGENGFVPIGVNGLIERVSEGIAVLEHHGEWFHIGIDAQDLFSDDPEDSNAQEILGLDNRFLELYHARVEDLIQKEEFHAASAVALLLTVLRSNDPAAWIMFGLTEQLCGRYISSACAFTSAIHSGADEHVVMYYASQGYVQLGKVGLAKQILERIFALTHENPSKKELRALVFKMLALI